MAADKLLHVHIADNTREPAGFGHTDFKEILRILKKIRYNGSLTMEFMYRLADPYSSKAVKTEAGLMDRYAKQSIDFIKMAERGIASG
jgi:sugar phosphate isomerase/epimerase